MPRFCRAESQEDKTLLASGMRTIGVMAAGAAGPVEGFKAGLSELGFVEGQSIRFELRVANGDLDRLPALAASSFSNRQSTEYSVPTVFAREQIDTGGGLFSYGTGLRRAAHRMARYTKKILDGNRPGDLPIEACLGTNWWWAYGPRESLV